MYIVFASIFCNRLQVSTLKYIIVYTVGVKKKFRIPFRRMAVAQLKKGEKTVTPFVEKRPFRSTALPF